MTVMAVTSRPLPLDGARAAWEAAAAARLERLRSSEGAGPSSSGSGGDAATAAVVKPCCAKKLAAAAAGAAAAAPGAIPRPVFGPMDGSQAALRELSALFDPARLAGQTALLEADGRRLRAGASILLSAAPEGGVLVQAVSPPGASPREQEHYLLGCVRDARLQAALLGMFLDPDACLDPGFARAAARRALWYVNGFKSYNADGSPHAREAGAPAPRPVRLPRRAARGAKWALPPPGEDPGAAAPELVGDVKRRAALFGLHRAFARAWAAADAAEAPEGADAAAVAEARRAAAEAALKGALGELGLDASAVSLPRVAAGDLAAAATPLQVP